LVMIPILREWVAVAGHDAERALSESHGGRLTDGVRVRRSVGAGHAGGRTQSMEWSPMDCRVRFRTRSSVGGDEATSVRPCRRLRIIRSRLGGGDGPVM
jgi:hypothetical protein